MSTFNTLQIHLIQYLGLINRQSMIQGQLIHRESLGPGCVTRGRWFHNNPPLWAEPCSSKVRSLHLPTAPLKEATASDTNGWGSTQTHKGAQYATAILMLLRYSFWWAKNNTDSSVFFRLITWMSLTIWLSLLCHYSDGFACLYLCPNWQTQHSYSSQITCEEQSGRLKFNTISSGWF